MNQSSDRELILEYLDGKNESLNILIKKYLKPIYNFVYIYTKNEQESEDIVQDVFLKVWKNIKRFKKDKNFKTWIYTIAKNTTIDFFKKKKNILFSETEKENDPDFESFSFEESIIDSNYLPDELYYKKEVQDNIRKLLDNIPIKYKEIINLYYIEEFNLKEISVILKQSINTIKSKHRRGLIMLKKQIEKL